MPVITNNVCSKVDVKKAIFWPIVPEKSLKLKVFGLPGLGPRIPGALLRSVNGLTYFIDG